MSKDAGNFQVTRTAQWTSGRQVEKFLDDFFRRRGYTIRRATPHEERVLCLGDRKFSKNDRELWVEYKSGIQTYYTGNIFLETVSVDATNKPGWVYTCKADFILYAALLNNKILVFRPDKLRQDIEDLKQRFIETKTGNNQNKGYNTHGVIVPLEYAEMNLADRVIIFDREEPPFQP